MSYPYGYHSAVYRLQQTETFEQWLLNLRDAHAKARILARLESARLEISATAKHWAAG